MRRLCTMLAATPFLMTACVAASRTQMRPAASSPAATQADSNKQVASIPKVQTLAQLQGLPVIHLASQWDIRLGYADPGPDAGPWILVYCLAHHSGARGATSVDSRNGPPEPLGPVGITATWSDDARPRFYEYMQVSLDNDGLYCASVLAERQGVRQIQIKDGQTLIAEQSVPIDHPPPCYWQRFAQLYRDGEHQGCRAVDKATARIPTFVGAFSLLRPYQCGLLPDSSSAFAKAASIGLPGTIPANPAWFMGVAPLESGYLTPVIPISSAPFPDQAPAFGSYALQLSLAQNTFTVRSAGLKLLDWPDWFLLSRWWVNGQPVVPPPGRDGGARDHARKLEPTKRMEVGFGYPDSLGLVRAGDKITLQVLYTPAGFEGTISDNQVRYFPMDADSGLSLSDSPLPLLSNKLEFTLTEELIQARAELIQSP